MTPPQSTQDPCREALAELVAAVKDPFPTLERGSKAQDAWAERRASALASAERALAQEPATSTEPSSELLQWAAKAAGMDDAEYQDGTGWMEDRYGYPVAIWSESLGSYWNPLEDDGDALRLAVKLGLVINLSPRDDCRGQTVVTYHGLCRVDEPCYDGREAAARRAIVRAAAAIGKAMPTSTGDGA